MDKPNTPRRTANWTQDEVFKLLELINERKAILKGKFGPTLTIDHKRRAWVEVTNDMNACFSHVRRTKEQVEKKWHNILVKGKRNLSTRKRLHSQTGGGPPEKVEDEAETDAVEDILGKDNVSWPVWRSWMAPSAANHMLNTFTRSDDSFTFTVESLDDGATSSLVSAPTLDGIRAAAATVNQPEGLAFNLPPRPPHDPLLGTLLDCSSHQPLINKILNQMLCTAKSQQDAWQAMAAHYTPLKK
ncbi:hypothetical protein GWK47_047719 [Chionoecetes opilio]|uniref:Regulatory protein zeste n=1 Tax=Chionoecetes opilio TaxID=41210 RepID=A0A8J5CV21_CHIOP|nr:hypothetical protein GWK47_047719 [Chionoecetes opilio]